MWTCRRKGLLGCPCVPDSQASGSSKSSFRPTPAKLTVFFRPLSGTGVCTHSDICTGNRNWLQCHHEKIISEEIPWTRWDLKRWERKILESLLNSQRQITKLLSLWVAEWCGSYLTSRFSPPAGKVPGRISSAWTIASHCKEKGIVCYCRKGKILISQHRFLN